MGSDWPPWGCCAWRRSAAEFPRWVAEQYPAHAVCRFSARSVCGVLSPRRRRSCGAVALAAAFSWNCSPRTAKVALGRWLREQPGPSPAMFGPDGFTQVVNYYARGRCVSFSPTSDEDTVRMLFAKCRPNVVLLPCDESPGCDRLVVRLVAAAGLRRLERGRLPASCAGVSVWMLDRKTGTGSVAQSGIAPGETLPPWCLSPFSAGGPSKKGTGTVAGDRAGRQTVVVATEPVPIFDCRPGAERVDRVPRPQGP